MQRYFITREQWEEGVEGDVYVTIEGEDARHLSRVLRGEPGFTFVVSDGAEREAVVEWMEERNQQIVAVVKEWLPMDHEPRVQVWIAQSLPKQDKLELIIQKGTEVGAAGFIPFTSERTIVHYDSKRLNKRMERWNKIAKEAAEQAHRNRIPEVRIPISWKQLLSEIEKYDVVLFCYEKPEGTSIREALQRVQNESRSLNLNVLIVVGPEGGFTSLEAEHIVGRSKEKAQVITLGPRILRTETAALIALACILYEFGEMEG